MNPGIFPFPPGVPALTANAALLVRAIRVLRSSDTVVAPFTGKMIYMFQAPGGSGASTDSSATSQRLASGGGAGEWISDVVDVVQGQSYVFTFGVPGAAVGATNTLVNGNDATDCSVVGPNGYFATVVGGKKGLSSVGIAAVLGGLGGQGGLGGTPRILRRPGSRGGNISNAPSGNIVATGGGASGIFGLPQDTSRGGDCSSTSAQTYVATGGGGLGGRGGDITGSNTTPSTLGGGSGGPAVDNSPSAPGPNIRGDNVVASPTDFIANLAYWMFDMFGGASSITSTNSGAGSGTLGAAGTSIPDQSFYSAGNFAGSGGIAAQTTAKSAKPGFGGGSGGTAGAGGTTIRTPAGGPALAVIYFVTPLTN